jgi:NADH-quinone oxidoreductase subunit M
MVFLTTILGAIAVSASRPLERKDEAEFYFWFLLLEACLLGAFMSLDLALFYFFWEASLIPAYLLVAGSGGEKCHYAAIKSLLCMLAGSVLMLLAILAVYHWRGTFDIREIVAHPFTQIDGRAGTWLFFGFLLASATQLPVFPFHTWLIDAHSEAPAAVSVILAGVAVKLGTYLLLRICLPVFPAEANHYRGIIIALSIASILYGGLLGLSQTSMKRVISYFTIGQIGLCVVGIFAFAPLGLSGSVLQQLNHGISIAALFLLVRALERRDLTGNGLTVLGLARAMPRFAAIFTIAMLSAIGSPALNGFVGIFAILRATLEIHPFGAFWAAAGLLLGATSLILAYQRTMFGSETSSDRGDVQDLSNLELAALVPLLALAFWIGLYPRPFFRVLEGPVRKISQVMNPASVGLSPPSGVLTSISQGTGAK